MNDLGRKTIIITGAAGLLGQNFATNFAKKGATLILMDINPALEGFSSKLRDDGFRVYNFLSDITLKENWLEILDLINTKSLSSDVLINNACIKTQNFFAPFEDYSLDEWRQAMEVNVTAAVLGCQVIGNEMAKNEKGSIINMASIYGVVAPDQRIYEGSEYLGKAISSPAVYTVSKSAIIGLTKYLATYWGKQKVRVNSVTPGGVFSGQNGTFVNNYSARVPLNRMATADDIYGAVSYLSSDCSSYVTGQNIIVDGGLTAW